MTSNHLSTCCTWEIEKLISAVVYRKTYGVSEVENNGYQNFKLKIKLTWGLRGSKMTKFQPEDGWISTFWDLIDIKPPHDDFIDSREGLWVFWSKKMEIGSFRCLTSSKNTQDLAWKWPNLSGLRYYWLQTTSGKSSWFLRRFVCYENWKRMGIIF